jgi:hypothetical protein
VANAVYEAGLQSNIQHVRTVGALTLIAFYFLLRVGEYTQPRYMVQGGEKIPATRTKQFTVGNVGLFKETTLLPLNAPLEVLLTATSATLKISNQKNG